MRFGQETPEFKLLTMPNFAAMRQKSVYNTKHLRISWTDLYLLYRFDRHMGGNDYLDIHLAVDQLNLGAVCRRRQEWPLLFALAFDNGFADREAAFKRLNGNNPDISCTILVNFLPIILDSSLHCSMFIRHSGVLKRIWRSQFWLQNSNWQSFLYILWKFGEMWISDPTV